MIDIKNNAYKSCSPDMTFKQDDSFKDGRNNIFIYMDYKLPKFLVYFKGQKKLEKCDIIFYSFDLKSVIRYQEFG